MKKSFLLLVVIYISSIPTFAQLSFSELPSIFTSSMPLPCYDVKDTRPNGVLYTYGMVALKETSGIPHRQYKNIQCTEWRDVSFSESDIAAPTVVMMMNIPGGHHKLYSVLVGGISDALTYSLVIVDSNGQVSDALEAKICWGPPRKCIKQTYIDENFNVIVHTIHPLSSDSISPFNFSSFQGQREDVCYRIVNGQFKETDRTKYKKRTFYPKDLTQDLWDGPDIPLLQKPTPPRQPNKKRKRVT